MFSHLYDIMNRRVHFAPGTKDFNKIPVWFPKSKPSYSAERVLKRAAVKELIKRINKVIIQYNELLDGSSPEELKEMMETLQELLYERADLERALERLEHNR